MSADRAALRSSTVTACHNDFCESTPLAAVVDDFPKPRRLTLDDGKVIGWESKPGCKDCLRCFLVSMPRSPADWRDGDEFSVAIDSAHHERIFFKQTTLTFPPASSIGTCDFCGKGVYEEACAGARYPTGGP